VNKGNIGAAEIEKLKDVCSKLWEGKNLLFSSTNMIRNLMDDLIDYS